MRTELNEIASIDQYLFHQLSEEEEKHFEAGLMINHELADRVEAQRLAHRLIRQYSREQELARLECVYRQLLREPSFAHQLKTIFC